MNNNFKNLGGLFEKYDNLVFFDTETTGLVSARNAIIELACVLVRKNGTRKEFDYFVEPYDHRPIPREITDITGITDEDVYHGNQHISEEEAAILFGSYLCGGKTLLIAHNAQFDLGFVEGLLRRVGIQDILNLFHEADYLDSLTIVKDRKKYPHKLVNCIEYYGLSGIVQNSHRAVDDTDALAHVVDAMAKERDDLVEYVNVFGFNPKYGVSGSKVAKITYIPQPYCNWMKREDEILPRRNSRPSYQMRMM